MKIKDLEKKANDEIKYQKEKHILEVLKQSIRKIESQKEHMNEQRRQLHKMEKEHQDMLKKDSNEIMKMYKYPPNCTCTYCRPYSVKFGKLSNSHW